MSRKLLVILGASLVAAAVVYVQPVQTQGAVVIHDTGCTLLNGNGGAVSADSVRAVVTPSGNGTLTCKVRGVANDTGRAAHFSGASTGISCGTPAGSTMNWHETVSASGNATLTCSVK